MKLLHTRLRIQQPARVFVSLSGRGDHRKGLYISLDKTIARGPVECERYKCGYNFE